MRPGIAQLAFLHVGNGFQDHHRIGWRLSEELDAIARDAGRDDDRRLGDAVDHTVEFYRRRGYAPTASPLAQL